MKFHISPKTQDVKPCSATIRGCLYGEETPHFNTQEDAFSFLLKNDKELAKSVERLYSGLKKSHIAEDKDHKFVPVVSQYFGRWDREALKARLKGIFVGTENKKFRISVGRKAVTTAGKFLIKAPKLATSMTLGFVVTIASGVFRPEISTYTQKFREHRQNRRTEKTRKMTDILRLEVEQKLASRGLAELGKQFTEDLSSAASYSSEAKLMKTDLIISKVPFSMRSYTKYSKLNESDLDSEIKSLKDRAKKIEDQWLAEID